MRDDSFLLEIQTPADLVRQALPWVAAVITRTDPDGQLSDLRAVQVCVDALKRAANRFDPYRSTWERWAVTAMQSDLERALESGQAKHSIELLTDAVFGAEAGA